MLIFPIFFLVPLYIYLHGSYFLLAWFAIICLPHNSGSLCTGTQDNGSILIFVWFNEEGKSEVKAVWMCGCLCVCCLWAKHLICWQEMVKGVGFLFWKSYWHCSKWALGFWVSLMRRDVLSGWIYWTFENCTIAVVSWYLYHGL